MPERETKPPKWGPTADPAPWPWPPRPWPPWDPIPWFWRHVPFPDPSDPIPFPYKFFEKIKIEDIIALRMANLEAMSKVFQVQLEAERALLEKQLEIMGQYK